jgi:hypothetical protein
MVVKASCFEMGSSKGSLGGSLFVDRAQSPKAQRSCQNNDARVDLSLNGHKLLTVPLTELQTLYLTWANFCHRISEHIIGLPAPFYGMNVSARPGLSCELYRVTFRAYK